LPKLFVLRYFIELSYFGEAYSGWQIQPNAISIQETLEKALTLILREPIKITGQGRTDAGVHAIQSFAHFDIAHLAMFPDELCFKLNSLLPSDIAIKRIFEVPETAHARFSPICRSYQYIISSQKNPFYHNRSWPVYRKLTISSMKEAAIQLMGPHDFTSFSSAKSDTDSRVCTINRLDFEAKNDLLIIHITADRFVMNMVRTIVGTLVEVGLGKRNPDEMASLLALKNRQTTGENAPACGLYLREVKYPEHIFTI